MTNGERRLAPSPGRNSLRAKSAETRDRIADVARDLFNAYGYTAVTTNRIALACGISPGNLYYHFRNREDILWYLFEGVEKRVQALFLNPEGLAATDPMERLRWQMAGAATILVEFRFFFPDQVAIMRRDERVERAYRHLQGEITGAFGRALQAMTGESAERSANLSHAIWVVATGWISFLLVAGSEVDTTTVARMVDMVVEMVTPRLK
ncbi:MAG: TetR/AcrR family transcriptional regulator [Zavarzinia sp.]|nr:TetR/AcrR family transcriptional regulator [Zavarzinia sp.]